MTQDLSPGDLFRLAFRHHPAGVVIIAADPGDGPVAITVSSLISVSAVPPTVAFSLSDQSASAQSIRRATTAIIHFPRRKDIALANLCATKGADRFGPGVNWERLPAGELRLADIALWFRVQIGAELAVPGATLVTATLLSGAAPDGGDAAHHLLVYANRDWHGLQGLRPAADLNLDYLDDLWAWR